MEFCSSHVYVYTNDEDEYLYESHSVEKDVQNSSIKFSMSLNTTCDSSIYSNLSDISNVTASAADSCDSDISKPTLNTNEAYKCEYDCSLNSIFSSLSLNNQQNENKTSSSMNQTSDDQALFYYSSDSIDESSSKRNEASNDEIYYDTMSDSSLMFNHFDDAFGYTMDEMEKLYKQTSVSHRNSIMNCPSYHSTKNTTKKVKIRKPDTNVIGIHLNELVQTSSSTHAGDAVFCKHCKAVITKNSKLCRPGDKTIWTCEFCLEVNDTDIDENEIAIENDITFLIEEPNANQIDDDSIIVFCIDISGSMNITKKVEGNVQLRGTYNRIKRIELETGVKYNYNQNETYISRLDSLQFSVEQNLEKLKYEQPKKRVFLIAFNNDIIIMGDGTTEPAKISTENFNDENFLSDYAERIINIKPIGITKHRLEERLYSLEANGPTSLGPALSLAINIASKKSGSQVILCTDGLANNGLGNLENINEKSIEFYENLAQKAIKLGVGVSIITLKGTDCKLSVIGQVAQRTNGYINCVDQLEMKNEMELLIEKSKFLASNVIVTVISHKSICIENDNDELLSMKTLGDSRMNKLVKNIGNVTCNSEITFQYGIICTDYHLNELNKIEKIPFQLQIQYEAKDGAIVMRVITEYRPQTKDRKIAEKNCSLDLLTRHILKSKAREVTNNIFLKKKFSSLPIKSKLDSLEQFLHEKKYKNDSYKKSLNLLIKATELKSLSIDSNRNYNNKIDTKNDNLGSILDYNSDEETETLMHLASLNNDI